MIEETLHRYARQDVPASGLQATDVLIEADAGPDAELGSAAPPRAR